MPSVDLVDETFVAAPPAAVAAVFADPVACRRFWPDLVLDVYADRGAEGVRWAVRGALVGTMEVWLEPVLDGTVLHYFLRADGVGPDGRPAPLPLRAAAREARRRRLAAKAVAFEVKAALEAGREVGCPPEWPEAAAGERGATGG
ncbi:hypothetical protein LX15_000394 [Streptoalloteichus tenebrarius]|uniref:Polyketide cyclase / dehydrase and lipid transport n=1 Tax=Streptoalloteichus tenebrarius (strain ATCC 17920 / DSM 40477 / JCM 4838 / CBS 697.72 / NBRC 16177 / NCIMB 11028 / NRRL B-12390 / A12253. 1 / ISP 5477) TaxID=1933 RepID=A0ABT1HMH5_STRSD|nr:polyketide cyclase / dehydrase and lipid transport [Streptoalloteichus tenebrarius]MCP2256711.1 hypothetical protein [Streptoalloteichus tenebrarius]BFF00389.1 hypothetical protein GCM10020241_20640 [Streptoalloteichus tenebrarius]